MIALYSVNLRIMGKANLSLLRMDTVYSLFENMGLSRVNSVIVMGMLCVAAIVCILYWFLERKSVVLFVLQGIIRKWHGHKALILKQ